MTVKKHFLTQMRIKDMDCATCHSKDSWYRTELPEHEGKIEICCSHCGLIEYVKAKEVELVRDP